MLSTLIYRSRAVESMRFTDLSKLLQAARQRNQSMQITGVLIFDGTTFVQLLEGPQHALDLLFESIRQDARHRDIVMLLKDDAPDRRFAGDQMSVLDLREERPGGAAQTLLKQLSISSQLASSDDRVLNILMRHTKKEHIRQRAARYEATDWTFPTIDAVQPTEPALHGQTHQFALQPIVDPIKREITSLEFLIRSRSGGSPEQFFADVPATDRHRVDLESKQLAFDLASRLGIRDIKLSVNLYPASLIDIPQAVDLLLAQIHQAGLSPRQVIVEVTEQEAISCPDAFRHAIVQLRRAGIGVAIDDFGAGFAGLSLLADFQPDKLKIDRKIIQGIHTDGPRQAIVLAILQACEAMGITPVAEGVELPEEWAWLQSAGIERFQGYLFARPALNRIPQICWPEHARQSLP